MSRVGFECMTPRQRQEARTMSAKERWIRENRNQIWEQCQSEIQSRVRDICNDRTQLQHKLMDSKDEYFRYCKAQRPIQENPYILKVLPVPPYYFKKYPFLKKADRPGDDVPRICFKASPPPEEEPEPQTPPEPFLTTICPKPEPPQMGKCQNRKKQL